MAANKNGFSDALKQINTLLKVNQTVQKDALEEAANYFIDVLKPELRRSKLSKKHQVESLKVKFEGDKFVVYFEKDAWYWFLDENGHKKRGGKGRVKGTHAIRNTFDKNADKIGEIMTKKIIDKMEG